MAKAKKEDKDFDFNLPLLQNHIDSIGDTKWISSKITPFDLIMGGGIPVGKAIEIFGAESTGKTTLALFMLKEIQENEGKKNGWAIYMDAESALSLGRTLDYVGIDPSRCVYEENNIINSVFKNIIKYVKAIRMRDKDCPIGILVDSIATLESEDETEVKEGEKGETKAYGAEAKQIKRHFRSLVGFLSRQKATLICINHIYDKMQTFGFGKKTDTPGGRAIKFYSSVRIELNKYKPIKDKDFKIGALTKVVIEKNKLTAPGGTIFLPIYFDNRGIPDHTAIFAHLSETGVIKKNRNKITFGKDEILVKDWKKYVKDNHAVLKESLNESIGRNRVTKTDDYDFIEDEEDKNTIDSDEFEKLIEEDDFGK